MNNSDPHNAFSCNPKPWNNNPNKIWLATSLRILRNLEKFKFPNKLTEEKKKQILALLSHEILEDKVLVNPKLMKAEELSPLEKEFLLEHFLSMQSFHQTEAGEGFIYDDSGEFLAVINIKDHLALQWIDITENLEKTWEKLIKVEMNLMQKAKYAFSPTFGFLTSDPTQCGTAFLANFFLHLPALIHTNRLNEIIEKYKDEGIAATGLHGDPSDMIGDIVTFHNVYTLGLTEESILTALRTLVTKIITEENSVRTRLRKDKTSEVTELKDKVSRAFGVLLHSYQIESIEALQAISLLKLGLDVDWIKGVDQKVLNDLLFTCRRAHLLCHVGKGKYVPEEIPHKRSEFIHNALNGVELLI